MELKVWVILSCLSYALHGELDHAKGLWILGFCKSAAVAEV